MKTNQGKGSNLTQDDRRKGGENTHTTKQGRSGQPQDRKDGKNTHK